MRIRFIALLAILALPSLGVALAQPRSQADEADQLGHLFLSRQVEQIINMAKRNLVELNPDRQADIDTLLDKRLRQPMQSALAPLTSQVAAIFRAEMDDHEIEMSKKFEELMKAFNPDDLRSQDRLFAYIHSQEFGKKVGKFDRINARALASIGETLQQAFYSNVPVLQADLNSAGLRIEARRP